MRLLREGSCWMMARSRMLGNEICLIDDVNVLGTDAM